MELLANRCTIASVLEHTGYLELPHSLQMYLFCSPKLDFSFRMLPSAGGLRDQRYRDFLEFSIIEGRLMNIQNRGH